VREKALAFAGVEPGKITLDVGAGTGFISEARVAAGLRVIAVDRNKYANGKPSHWFREISRAAAK
jgi:precorrin-6B methylase 2